MATERHKVIINVQNNQDWWWKFKNKWAGHGLVLLRISPLVYGALMALYAAFFFTALLVGDYKVMANLAVLSIMSYALWCGAYAYRHCNFEYLGKDE